jgi:hypothetical protein
MVSVNVFKKKDMAMIDAILKKVPKIIISPYSIISGLYLSDAAPRIISLDSVREHF